MYLPEIMPAQAAAGRRGPVLALAALLALWLVACQKQSAAPAPLPATGAAESALPASNTPPALPALTPATPTLPPPVLAEVVRAPTATPGGQTPTAPPETQPPAPPTALSPAGLIGPDFPPDIDPLTGETVDPERLQHRPLAIKVSNSSAVVRPQSGLNDADLVFEHYAEGGITRFTAVFWSHDAPLVGPVRSGRLIDLEIPKMYDAAFAYSGSSGPVRQMIRDSPFFARVISPDFGHSGFWRDYTIGNPDKPAWETLYTNTETLRAVLQGRGEDVPPTLPANLVFDPTPPNGEAVSSLEIRYLATDVYWQYDAGTGRYLRWADGQPHLDGNSGQQLTFRNIIVLGANHVDTLILEDEVAGGHFSIQIQIWGEGPVSLFRDGQRLEGRWRREEPNQMFTLYDLEGNRLPLRPGNSFVQVVPLNFNGLTTQP